MPLSLFIFPLPLVPSHELPTVHLMVAEKQREGERKGLGFQYLLQGHVPTDLTSFHKPHLLKVPPPSPTVAQAGNQAFSRQISGNF